MLWAAVDKIISQRQEVHPTDRKSSHLIGSICFNTTEVFLSAGSHTKHLDTHFLSAAKKNPHFHHAVYVIVHEFIADIWIKIAQNVVWVSRFNLIHLSPLSPEYLEFSLSLLRLNEFFRGGCRLLTGEKSCGTQHCVRCYKSSFIQLKSYYYSQIHC